MSLATLATSIEQVLVREKFECISKNIDSQKLHVVFSDSDHTIILDLSTHHLDTPWSILCEFQFQDTLLSNRFDINPMILGTEEKRNSLSLEILAWVQNQMT